MSNGGPRAGIYQKRGELRQRVGVATYRGLVLAREWPLESFLELGALPGAVPCARLHARLLMAEWHLTRLSENVEILVSELVTNAVTASRSLDQAFPVRLWLRSDNERVLILVWDASPHMPTCLDTADDAENGRGLLLVEALSDRWDWYVTPEPGGKVVWAAVAPA
ncbi:MAG: ATP-binding protein [Streptosporangiaceae bacterium]|jgi:anti-sigma regulatory factor (Ser/Thr protein kinase)